MTQYRIGVHHEANFSQARGLQMELSLEFFEENYLVKYLFNCIKVRFLFQFVLVTFTSFLVTGKKGIHETRRLFVVLFA